MNAEPVSVYLSLGSNVGDRKRNLDRAISFLSERLRIEEISSVYDTTPEDNPDQPRFLNLVAHAYTTLEPTGLLALLKGIESKLGRVPSARYSPRPMDIDILFYGKQVINTPTLTIPHTRIPERAFVLVPLNEIAPELVHPVSGKPVKQMLAELKRGVQGVFKFVQPGESGTAEAVKEEVKDNVPDNG
ncbi:MAG: 2-amino-4-hydroxy-6-hydroxymethyldihydropteridine diphosphokinase [Dehalococcoidia bacterium]|nr:MAG: 2-amino-4-hydroxy-6-hydroxymethyldihydropteridine diphosphokinase [Dehalococcoidia bacterium]